MFRPFAGFLGLAVLVGGFAAPAEAAKKEKDADPQAQFEKLDGDKDGKVTLEEFTKSAKDAEKAKKKFGKIDSNNDSSLSLEEFKAAAEKKKDK